MQTLRLFSGQLVLFETGLRCSLNRGIPVSEMEDTGIMLFKSVFTDNADLRVFLDDEKTPWFVGVDICNVLQYKNNNTALIAHVDEEDKMAFREFCKKTEISHANKLHPQTMLINECGLYSLVTRSKLPAAKGFKRCFPMARKYDTLDKIREVESRIREIENEKETLTDSLNLLQTKYDKLSKNHNSMLTRRSYHKFKKGPCFYIVADEWRNVEEFYKVGETSNINQRLATYRTAMPRTKILYLVYLSENKLLETTVKAKFKHCLSDMNKEYIAGVALETIMAKVEMIVKFFHFDTTRETELELYNKAIDVEEHLSDSELLSDED